MTTFFTNSFPYRMDGTYVLDNVKTGRGTPITGGSGEISFFHDESNAPIAGQAWPSAITWNDTEKWFECEISKDCETTLGELVRGEVTIDANGKRYTDVLRIRVRAPSSEI